MENETETIDSSNDETQEVASTDAPTSDSSEAKYTEREKQYYARLKKAEAEVKELRSKVTESKPQSDDFGYDVKAYLKSSGIKANEFEFVQTELKKSGADIDTLLDNEYFQARLEKHRAIAATEAATPTGKRSGGAATDSVDYWMGKPMEDVPKDMRIKVVNARLDKEKNKNVFYNS